jgi:hypothetical protein
MYAQLQRNTDECYKETNLFEYGAPLTSGEVNLKNLFNNFPKFVKNAGEIELLSYQYTGNIKNLKSARRFVKKNMYSNAPAWNVTTVSGGHETGGKNANQPVIILDVPESLPFNKSERNKFINKISEEYIRTGDEVYRIKYVFRLKTYEQYIFINPKTKQVVTEGNIFGFSFLAPNLNK